MMGLAEPAMLLSMLSSFCWQALMRYARAGHLAGGAVAAAAEAAGGGKLLQYKHKHILNPIPKLTSAGRLW